MNLFEEARDKAFQDLFEETVKIIMPTVFCFTCRTDRAVGECGHVEKCFDCGNVKQIGDFPFCPHGAPYWREANAKAFEPILAWEYEDGTIGSTGSNDESISPGPGARPIMITTLRQADALTRRVNAQEQEQIDRRTEEKRNHHERGQRESRTQLRAELERRGISAQNVDAIIQDRDGKGPDKNAVMQQFEAACAASGKEFNRDHFEKVYETTQRTRRNPEYRGRPQATFGIEVFERDSSNREGYRSEHTGWKYRKS